jgi:uncharacterized protein YkwD
MKSVSLVVALALLLGGCGVGSQSSMLSSGFAGGDTGSAGPEKRIARASSNALGAEPAPRAVVIDKAKPAVKNQQVASLNDKVPNNSFEKAPKGSLSDRDYSGTALDAMRAMELVNAYRQEKGLKPVKLNASLTDAAKAHSRDLAKFDRISHFGSDGSNPWDRVKKTGYSAKLAAENVGTGQLNIDEVMKGWKASPGHNKNLLLADAEHMGIALVHDPKTEFKTFWTLVIGSGQ